MKNEKEFFMRKAILQAKRAASIGEVPVGAVLVSKNKIISRGYNKRETKKNCLMHAEIEAINKACKKLGGWRLFDCDLYVTLEPCPMCAGAIINARIKNVYFGAYDEKGGAVFSVEKMFSLPYNHKPNAQGGILEEDCAEILKDFFKDLRAKKQK